MTYIFVIIAVLSVVAFCFMYNKTNRSESQQPPEEPLKLLDLNTTTLSERQHYYKRGFRRQLQYDELQRRAEAANDTATLEALRLRTYDGPLPVLKDDPLAEVPRVSTRGKSSRHPIVEPKVQRLRYFCIKDKGYHVSVWPKDQGIGDCVQFPLAGITHATNVSRYLGESVCQLAPQPTNSHDPNAIEIVAHDGHHLGFVPKDMTAEVRRHTHLPASCYVYIGQNPDEGTYYTCCYFTIDYDNLP